MHNPIGLASGPAKHLTPRKAPPQFQVGGQFTALLGALLPGKELSFLPQEIELALLTAPPKPEGNGHVELSAAGYHRQFVRLVPSGVAGHDTNEFEVRFDLGQMEVPCVTHIAIIAADNRVLFSGPLQQIRQEKQESLSLEIQPYNLRLRRSQL